MIAGYLTLALSLLWVGRFEVEAEGEQLKRLPRIRTGLHYKEHDDVLLTVTKVG